MNLTLIEPLTPPLVDYLEAIEEGQWLNIAKSEMNDYERQIACSWHYQSKALAHLSKLNLLAAGEWAQLIPHEKVRFDTWVRIAHAYRQNKLNLTLALQRAIWDDKERRKTRRAIDMGLRRRRKR